MVLKRRGTMKTLFFMLFLCLFIAPDQARAELNRDEIIKDALALIEKAEQVTPVIHNFEVDITVHDDASLTVHERITYHFGNEFTYHAGNGPRHGIYRNIPFMVNTTLGSWDIGIKIHDVSMDGHDVPWDVDYGSPRDKPRVFIKIGDPDHTISGTHVYDIRYDVAYGILPLNGSDDMRWNVTGDQWKVMIKKASVTVHLPQQLSKEDIQVHTYSGSVGSTSTQATFNWRDRQTFHADVASIAPGEGLTISLSYPEGALTHSAKEIAEMAQPGWLRTHWHWYTLLFGCIWIFLYWFLYGRDPSAGNIMPRYHPPEGIEVAHASLILHGALEDDCMPAVILELARDNYLNIKQDKNKQLTLIRLNPAGDALPTYKIKLMNALFHDGDTLKPLLAEKQQLRHISDEFNEIKEDLSAWSVEQGYMKNHPEEANRTFLWKGMLLACLAIIAACVDSNLRYGDDMAFHSSLWFVGGVLFYRHSVEAIKFIKLLIRSIRYRFMPADLLMKGVTLFGFSFILYYFYVNGSNNNIFSPTSIKVALELLLDVPLASQLMLVALVCLAAPLMSVKTGMGTGIYTQLLGLKDFMLHVNRDELERRLQENSDYMHALLPYATAFDILEHWVEQIDVLGLQFHTGSTATFSSMNIGDITAISTLSSAMAASFSSSSGGGSGSGSGGGGGGSW